MRTIKFRGKRTKQEDPSERWIYGTLAAWRDIYDRERTCIVSKSGYHNDVDPETVGQFTGLLDKNGREIYEGDILMFGSSDAGICEVKWNESQLAFCIRFYYERNLGIRPLGAWARDEKDIAILGNIHDNPELLNEK